MTTDPQDIEVVSSANAEDQAAISAYWTDDRMAQAQPLEPQISEVELLAALAPEVWSQSGNLTVMESQAPDGQSIQDHPAIQGASNTFKTTRVQDRDDLPYSTVGKMFMTFDGADFVGTGWVVAEKAVFSAGHCVFDGDRGGWADNILFVPQYDNGSAPVGRWTSVNIHSLKGWTEKGDYRYDMAAFETNTLIRPKTGSLGWMANFPPNQGPYKSIGYPARPVPGYNFNGAHMWQSIGGYITGNNPIQMHNNMTPGCSGGPWVVSKSQNVYANGLNSFRYTNEPGTMYSPYFGQGFLNLYEAVKSLR